jgi:long-chain acyl-CoA synthetase
VGIISNNRWEWATIAAATYSLNATIVPLYEAQLPADWTYILNDAGCTSLFCADQDIFDRVHVEVLPSTPLVKSVLCLDAAEGEPHAFSTHMSNATEDTPIIVPTENDLADLIYTSGTTGKPKGVELTHLNLTSNVKSAVRSMVEDPSDFVRQNDRSLAFLPWAHSYGQTCELWSGMSHGASMGICRGIPSILEDLQLVKPTVLFSVPTLYKRIYDGVHNLMETSSPLRKKLMKKALYLGRQNADSQHGKRGPLGLVESIQFKALDSVVLSKIRDRFGGRLRHGFVAGAATPSQVLDFMDSLSIPVCEGYGLTETSPIITLNTPEHRMVGSVGRAIGGVTVYILGEDGKPVGPGMEGEICCVGPNVMRSYYRNQAATDEVISVAPDGVSRM